MVTLNIIYEDLVNRINRTLLALSLSTALILSGCTSSGGGSDDNASGGGSNSPSAALRQQNSSATTNSSGIASFSFVIQPGENAFQIVAGGIAAPTRLIKLVDPTGRVLINESTDSRVTGAITKQTPPVVYNGPTLDYTVVQGTYTATLEVADAKGNPFQGVLLNTSVVTKSDSDLSRGTLSVNMILVGPVGDSNAIRSGLQDGVNIWREIFARAKIDLDVQWFDAAGTDRIPNPFNSDAVYGTFSSAFRSRALNVAVGSIVQDSGRFDVAAGNFGSSPGAAISTNKSAVALSLLNITGSDGQFDVIGRGGIQIHNDETRLAGEELAQLAGHYLGLTHSVDSQGAGYSSRIIKSDLLSDTESCATVLGCSNSESARSNFMFPFALRKFVRDIDEFNMPREFFARGAVSDQQAAVMNRSVLVQ
jgi:hypothetical protein